MFKYTIIKMLKTNQIKINDWIYIDNKKLDNQFYTVLCYANDYQEAFKKVRKFRESENIKWN